MISQIPLDKRNFLAAATSFLFLKERYADTPAKKTKVGAQKCVIHLVKKRMGVVVVISVGLCVSELTCIISRV